MFRKKPKRFVVQLSKTEARLLLEAMISFRNRVAREGLPTEDINELILRLTK